MTRYFIRISFKGTRYAGWQIQDNAVTVQELLNNTLRTLLKEEVKTTGCGRTDTGVHAKQFYVHFDSDNLINDSEKFIYSANSILPDDIVVHELLTMPETAHARFDAISRTYEYYISSQKNAFLKEHILFHFAETDIEKMNLSCKLLVGKRDFSSFSKSHTQVKTNVCDIKFAHWENREGVLVFTITADRFLRGMVRAIVGTMLEIGTGKLATNGINDIIESRDRSKAGLSVPACGLYLSQIKYSYINDMAIYKFPC